MSICNYACGIVQHFSVCKRNIIDELFYTPYKGHSADPRGMSDATDQMPHAITAFTISSFPFTPGYQVACSTVVSSPFLCSIQIIMYICLSLSKMSVAFYFSRFVDTLHTT